MNQNELEKSVVRRKVLITGSTQGIGKAVAARLVKEGYEVTVHCSRDLEKAERIKNEIGASHAVVCDLANMNEVDGLYSKTDGVDILILNASVQYKHKFYEVTDAELDNQIDVNFKSTFKLINAYYPYMKERGFGRIITLGSVNQKNNHPELSIYGATKNAVLYLVKNIAKQVAPYGVTVNNLAPGAILTPRNQSVYDDDAARKSAEKQIPLGRFGKPDEMCGILSFLCGEESGYVTGADIFADGGMSL